MQHWEEIQIGHFSGPLDLLLTMIREKKMSITDVNLVSLTDQYLLYLESQKLLDIEIASEYLALAAQLIEMKSVYLLPKDLEQVFEEDNVYEDFLDQLSRYEQIRSVTDFFLEKQTEYFQTFSKPRSKTKFSNKTPQLEVETETMIDPLDLDLETFSQVFKRVMMHSEMRNHELLEEMDVNFNTITTENISPQEISAMILKIMQTNKLKTWKLEELLTPDWLNLKNLISTFLAVLDLVRYQVVRIQQAETTLLVEFSPEALKDTAIIENVEARWNE